MKLMFDVGVYFGPPRRGAPSVAPGASNTPAAANDGAAPRAPSAPNTAAAANGGGARGEGGAGDPEPTPAAEAQEDRASTADQPMGDAPAGKI
ncbi:hypothetical protein N7540_012259 [Penicillium herquei]|nr:hypothetical protein N7540_012259 [Penicillium herquei]